jgi:hypothetical protein
MLLESAEAGECFLAPPKAAKSNFRDEPLLDAILISLKWASSEGKGQFMAGNIVDQIYAARARRKEKHSDAEVYEKLEEIRRQCLDPYYQKLKTEGKQNA